MQKIIPFLLYDDKAEEAMLKMKKIDIRGFEEGIRGLVTLVRKLSFTKSVSEVKLFILPCSCEYRGIYLSDDIGDIRKELREEFKSLKNEIRRQVSQALEKPGNGTIRVDLNKDDMAQTEPSFVVVKDLVKQIRENVKSSLATRGEIAVDELVDSMPETTAADLLKSLANTDRLKMVKVLYTSKKTFSDFKTITGLEAASV